MEFKVQEAAYNSLLRPWQLDGPCIHRIGPNHRIGQDRARNWLISSFLKHFLLLLL